MVFLHVFRSVASGRRRRRTADGGGGGGRTNFNSIDSIDCTTIFSRFGPSATRPDLARGAGRPENDFPSSLIECSGHLANLSKWKFCSFKGKFPAKAKFPAYLKQNFLRRRKISTETGSYQIKWKIIAMIPFFKTRSVSSVKCV